MLAERKETCWVRTALRRSRPTVVARVRFTVGRRTDATYMITIETV